MYNFYHILSHNFKHHLDRCKLVKFMQSKVFKMIRNVKMQRILCCPLITKWILIKYRSLVVNMFDDQTTIVTSKANFLRFGLHKFFIWMCLIFAKVWSNPRYFSFAILWPYTMKMVKLNICSEWTPPYVEHFVTHDDFGHINTPS